MQKSLPVLSLPAHTLDLVITEADSDDEKIRNLSATVMHHPGSSDQPARIDVSDLKADMPRGDLAGSIELATADEWTARLQAEIVTRSREPEQLKGLESTDWLWTSGQPAQTGIAIPDIGFWQSQLKIDARLTADQVKMPGVTLSGVDLLLIHCCCSAENSQ